jgi:hypothetical protein
VAPVDAAAMARTVKAMTTATVAHLIVHDRRVVGGLWVCYAMGFLSLWREGGEGNVVAYITAVRP